MDNSTAESSPQRMSKTVAALLLSTGVIVGATGWYAYGAFGEKTAVSVSRENGALIGWHFARYQVQQNLPEEMKKMHGPVRINGRVITCPDSQSEFIWSLKPPSGSDLLADAKKRSVIVAYAAGIGCNGQRRITTVQEDPVNHHWTNATAVASDNEISWLYHCLVKDLDDTERARDQEFRKSPI